MKESLLSLQAARMFRLAFAVLRKGGERLAQWLILHRSLIRRAGCAASASATWPAKCPRSGSVSCHVMSLLDPSRLVPRPRFFKVSPASACAGTVARPRSINAPHPGHHGSLRDPSGAPAAKELPIDSSSDSNSESLGHLELTDGKRGAVCAVAVAESSAEGLCLVRSCSNV